MSADRPSPAGKVGPAAGAVRTLADPLPRPGRVAWRWLLGLPWRRRRVRHILRLLDGRVGPHSLLLDVGGGTGVGSDEAARRAPPGTYRRRIVLDPQPGMFAGREWSRSARAGVDPVVADGVRLPIPDRSVDVVLSLGVLCCMSDAAVPRAVVEMFRVLRPGGLAVVTVPRARGDADEPALLAAGFRRVAQLRPGRTLYGRPGTGEIPRAVTPTA